MGKISVNINQNKKKHQVCIKLPFELQSNLTRKSIMPDQGRRPACARVGLEPLIRRRTADIGPTDAKMPSKMPSLSDKTRGSISAAVFSLK
jgi:hypothetical protein